jgi:uncharacterized protein DUF4292
MMKKYIAITLLVVLASCKSKAVLAEAGATKKLTSEKIIESHYANKKDFSTLYIKAGAHYEDAKQSQNVSAEIRIKKDEIILVSIRFIGITMAKALITPTKVQYYEKINGEYFEGDYSTLSKWLGTDLNFKKVQNLLIGEALDNLRKEKYTASIEEQLYKLSQTDSNTEKNYYFEAGKFSLKKARISQVNQNRSAQIFYPAYTDYNQVALPTGVIIEALHNTEKTNINIDYNSISFNEELSFPYSVPEGYERININ